MKPGEKYIIEIDHTTKTADGERAYIKGFRTLVFDQYGLDKLENLYSTARLKAEAKMRGDEYRRGLADGLAGTLSTKAELDAAYKRGFESGRALTRADGNAKSYAEGYNDGMEKAWSMVRAMYKDYAIRDLKRVFNCEGGTASDILSIKIVCRYTPQQVKEKLDAFEKEKTEIHVGDEVKFSLSETRFVVTHILGEHISGFSSDGRQFREKRSCNWEKTGRHFDVAALLDQMKDPSVGAVAHDGPF